MQYGVFYVNNRAIIVIYTKSIGAIIFFMNLLYSCFTIAIFPETVYQIYINYGKDSIKC
jgi:hypothetical protein